jgi:hypothetical protein
VIHSIGPKTHVLKRFGPFRYCTKVDVKLAEQVPLSHKFSKQSRVGIFRNERTRSNPLEPKLIFLGISDHFVTTRKSMQNWPNGCHYRTSSINKVALEFFATNAPDPLHLIKNSCFGASRTVSLLHESRSKTGRTGAIIAQVRYAKSRRNFSQRMHSNNSIVPKTQVLGRFGLFRYCTKVDAQLAVLVPLSHKFSKQSRIGIFRNERTRSTPFHPKLMFWGISDRFVTVRKSMQNWPNSCH